MCSHEVTEQCTFSLHSVQFSGASRKDPNKSEKKMMMTSLQARQVDVRRPLKNKEEYKANYTLVLLYLAQSLPRSLSTLTLSKMSIGLRQSMPYNLGLVISTAHKKRAVEVTRREE